MSVKLTIEPKVMFSYPSAKEFTYILKSVAELVEEVSFRVENDGLKLKALDPGRIAMLTVTLPPEAFQEFQVSEPINIGLSVGNLVKVLKHLRKNDRVTIAANEEYVEIIIEGTSVRRYKFRNIEVLSEEIPELNVEYDVEGSVLVGPLRNAISELSNLTDTIGVSVREEAIVMYDYDTKKTQYRFSSTTGTLISLSIKKSCEVAFDSEYLSKIVDILRLGSVADIRFGSEAPLNIEITMSVGGRAQYFLAAKV